MSEPQPQIPAPVEPFVGRAAELAALEAAYAGKDSALIPIYGRRRIGKSELILHFMRNKPGLYHVGKLAPSALQLRELLNDAAALTGEPLLTSATTEDWRLALDTIVERWRGPKRLVIALDEFQWTAQAAPGLPSVLQELWDRKWRRHGKVMLILCGSYIGFMEREVLGKKSPLFGRRTGQIKLAPFGYREAAEFHPKWSLADRAQAYFLCGGVPLYLRMFDAARSIRGNIEASFLSEHAALFQEPEFLLREELRDVQNYYGVLWAIAAGHGTQSEIADATGLQESSLPYWLNQLLELGYIARRRPLVGRRFARSVRYVLEDAMLRFWFRFVFPHKSFIQQRGARAAWTELISGEIDSYFGTCFERLAREALPVLYERERVSASYQIGEYWDREVQIDVVGVRDDERIDLGEAKWGPVRSPGALVEELSAKIRRYPNAANATIEPRFFLRSRPRGRTRPAGHWHDLEDLYS